VGEDSVVVHASPDLLAEAVAARLMVALCGARLAPGTVDVGGAGPPPARIPLRERRVSELLGAEIPRARSAEILDSLGFGVDETQGALEAAVQARDEGLVRFIGVTGHGAQIAANHRRSLERFDFDSVLLPYNRPTMRLPYYAENFNALLDTCRQRKVAVQTIKSVARAPWLGRQRSAATWYEPFTEQADIDPAVWWALGEETVFLNSVGDVDILPRFLDAASRYQGRPSEAEIDALFERLQPQPIFV